MKYILLVFCSLSLSSYSKGVDLNKEGTNVLKVKETVVQKLNDASDKLTEAKVIVDSNVKKAKFKISDAFTKVRKEIEAAVKKIVKRITGK